jgi:hypothetical protein
MFNSILEEIRNMIRCRNRVLSDDIVRFNERCKCREEEIRSLEAVVQMIEKAEKGES